MANTSAFQAEDAGSIPVVPSSKAPLFSNWKVGLFRVRGTPCGVFLAYLVVDGGNLQGGGLGTDWVWAL